MAKFLFRNHTPKNPSHFPNQTKDFDYDAHVVLISNGPQILMCSKSTKRKNTAITWTIAHKLHFLLSIVGNVFEMGRKSARIRRFAISICLLLLLLFYQLHHCVCDH